MYFIELGILVLIGGLIGWVTNKVAIKMLFRPIKEIKILFFKFQGVLPKRKHILGESIGQAIESEFISKDDIIDKVFAGNVIDNIKLELKTTLARKIKEIIPPMMLMMLSNNLDEMISKFVDEQGDEIIASLINKVKEEGFSNLNISNIVKEKIDNLDFIEFEKLVYKIMKKELKHIERVGMILGMFIGFIQFLITRLI